MPSIVANIQDKQNIARWKKAYSVISQAYAQTVNEGYEPCTREHVGCPDVAELGKIYNNNLNNPHYQYFLYDKAEGIREEFKIQFISKFNGAKVCDTANKCKLYSNEIIPRTLSGGRILYYNMSGMKIKLSTGELIIFGGTHGGPWLTVDVNGAENGPNVLGRDIYVMKLYDNVVKPMGAYGTYKPSSNGDECLCGKEYGLKEATYFAGAAGAGEVASGACCSAVYLSK